MSNQPMLFPDQHEADPQGPAETFPGEVALGRLTGYPGGTVGFWAGASINGRLKWNLSIMCTIIAKKWSINWRNPIQNTFTVTFARQNATEMRVSHSNHIGCDPMLADMRTRIETRIDLSE